MFNDLLQRLLDLPAGPVYATIGAMAAIENIFPPIPADTAVALGAFLAGAGDTVTVLGVFGVTWGANVLGASAVYAGTRTAGRAFFKSRMGARLLDPRSLARIEHLYDRHGLWGIFFSRFIPAVRAVVPPFAGIAGLDPVRALAPVAVASGIWYGILAWVASTLIQHVGDIRNLLSGLNWAGLGLLAVLVIAAAVVIARRKRRPRDEGGA